MTSLDISPSWSSLVGRVSFSFATATMKPFNNLIYMSSLTEIISSAVVIALQSQLKDYVPTGVGAKHNGEAEQCFCKWRVAAIPALMVTLVLLTPVFNWLWKEESRFHAFRSSNVFSTGNESSGDNLTPNYLDLVEYNSHQFCAFCSLLHAYLTEHT